jgi:hypothetical protein
MRDVPTFSSARKKPSGSMIGYASFVPALLMRSFTPGHIVVVAATAKSFSGDGGFLLSCSAG